MNLVIKIFIIIFKLLNYWIFKIPGKLSIFAFAGYNLFIYFYFGAWSMTAVKEVLGGTDTIEYFLFIIFIAFPCFWSFFSMFAMTMDGPRFGGKINSVLDNVIAYRNGQMNISTPQNAFEIYKDTAHLDVLNANRNSSTFEQAVMGFNAKHGNSSPQKIFDAFANK